MSQESQGQDARTADEITWVGEQRLMQGYCGRATGAEATPPPIAARDAASAARAGRPVAVVRGRPRRRDAVVRLAPQRPAAPHPDSAPATLSQEAA